MSPRKPWAPLPSSREAIASIEAAASGNGDPVIAPQKVCEGVEAMFRILSRHGLHLDAEQAFRRHISEWGETEEGLEQFLRHLRLEVGRRRDTMTNDLVGKYEPED